MAQFVATQIRAVDDLIAEAEDFLRAPAFTGAWGTTDDESTADAEGIVWAANRLADYCERLLELAEECRRTSVPEQFAELVRDSVRLMNQPLQDFGGFINDVLERVEQLQKRVMLGQYQIRFEAVPLRTTTDDRLVWSIIDRLKRIE